MNTQSNATGGKLDVTSIVEKFKKELLPIEQDEALTLFSDNRTGAQYCECHIYASKLISLGTTDAPLDPETQPGYRANREIVDNELFARMVDDANKHRSFS